jgi:hypothetical protein
MTRTDRGFKVWAPELGCTLWIERKYSAYSKQVAGWNLLVGDAAAPYPKAQVAFITPGMGGWKEVLHAVKVIQYGERAYWDRTYFVKAQRAKRAAQEAVGV